MIRFIPSNLTFFSSDTTIEASKFIDISHLQCLNDIFKQKVEQNFVLVKLFVAISLIIAANFSITWMTFYYVQNQQYKKRKPPVLPHIVPIIGNLPLGYLWNPMSFVINPRSFFWKPHPIRLSIFTKDLYIVQGSEFVKEVFKHSWMSTSTFFHQFSLRYAFGMPEASLAIYDNDDSGGGPKPYPTSRVEPRNRVDYKVYQSLVHFLLGPGINAFWNRFSSNVIQRLQDIDVGNDWEYWPDFMVLFREDIFIASTDALCGKHLLRRNPTMGKDFWELDHDLLTLLKGTPWAFAPGVYRARQRVLNAIKDWQSYARHNFDKTHIHDDGDDPYWGSRFFRDRQGMFMEMDGFDYDAIASEDFGAFWAATRNSIVAAFWTIYEIFKDHDLTARVREEARSCIISPPGAPLRFNIDELMRKPLLQSIYAEMLRLRVHIYIVRVPEKQHMDIYDWIIPRQKILAINTTPAHFDSAVWNTGPHNEHPVDKFWAERFLRYPNDPLSGPKKPKHDILTKSVLSADRGKPEFTTAEVEGSWIPYGGGPRKCPGRHFAKREILVTTALVVSMFDCEILGNSREIEMDNKGYGLGTMSPLGEIPVRIRRKTGPECIWIGQ